MSTTKRRRSVSFRPGPEVLEGRQLLSNVFRGVDIDGDLWTLRLVGPGALRVTNQPGPDGVTPVPIGQPGLINTIQIQGANPATTRLIGTVQRAPGGDGRVFFENLLAPASVPPGPAVGVGLLAIDMPDFWLGDTSPGGTAQIQGRIDIPDGVVTLRFGGVDTTASFGADPGPLGQSRRFTVNLGLPTRIGTSIVVDRVITSNRPTEDPLQTGAQDTVTFTVAGRLNLFQANAIEGDPTLDLEDGPFDGQTLGGTTVIAQPPQLATGGFGGVTTGAIGRFRVGGDATNLNVQVTGSEARLTNLFIGGETNKVSVTAFESIRTALFGLGMDTVAIQTGQIEQLGANRGAVGSSVLVSKNAGSMAFGGDVINTNVLAGYSPAQAAGAAPTAQPKGQMTVRVAGDVFDSIFAASVQPFLGTFGGPDDIVLPSGYINAKVEGLIDNSLNPSVDPTAADRAFFAARVRLEEGPVVPPAAPGAPYRPAPGPGRTPGVEGISGGPSSPTFRFVQRQNARRAS